MRIFNYKMKDGDLTFNCQFQVWTSMGNLLFWTRQHGKVIESDIIKYVHIDDLRVRNVEYKGMGYIRQRSKWVITEEMIESAAIKHGKLEHKFSGSTLNEMLEKEYKSAGFLTPHVRHGSYRWYQNDQHFKLVKGSLVNRDYLDPNKPEHLRLFTKGKMIVEDYNSWLVKNHAPIVTSQKEAVIKPYNI